MGQQGSIVVLQAEQQGVSSDSSAVLASGSDSRSNIRSSIYQLVVRSQAYWRNRSVGWTVGVAVIGYNTAGRSSRSRLWRCSKAARYRFSCR